MRIHKLLLICFFTTQAANGQLIKNSFGENAAINEKTQALKAEVVKREAGWRYGFDVDFEFSFGLEAKRRTSFVAQIEKITIHKEKGWFHQGYNDKAGKYYPCSKLNNLCETSELIGINIWGVWEFNGKEFKTGSLYFSNRRDDKSYLRKPIDITAPGGSGITPDDVKSGAAKLVRIEIASWSFSNTDPIMNIVRETK